MTSGATEIRLLPADDHAVVLEGLVAMIGRQSDMSVVAEESTEPEAVELWRTQKPDVALIDIRRVSGRKPVVHRHRHAGQGEQSRLAHALA
jgi:DNA-binding NarL/FixJ family response regulator